jgi:hypothetical protein
LTEGGAEFDFTNDDAEMTDLGGVYFAEIVGDFDDVERLDGLGDS